MSRSDDDSWATTSKGISDDWDCHNKDGNDRGGDIPSVQVTIPKMPDRSDGDSNPFDESDEEQYDYDYDYSRRARSAFKTIAIDRMNKTDPFIWLAGPDSKEYKEFMGSQANPAQLLMHDGSHLPSSLGKNQTGLRLSLEITGGKLAKRIAIIVRYLGGTIKRLHHIHIEFFPGLDEVADLSYSEHDEGRDGNRAPDLLVVKWTSKGGHGTGLTLPTADYDGEMQDAMEYLRSLSTPNALGTHNIKIIVKANDRLRSQLETISDNISSAIPWRPYLDLALRPRCAFKQMTPRKSIEAYCGSMIRLPAKNSFATPEEAHISLAYGTTLEFREGPQESRRSSWPRTMHNAVYLQRQLEALDILFDQSADDRIKAWVAVILNQSTETLQRHDPLSVLGTSEHAAKSKMDKILDILPWITEQRKALEASQNLQGGVSIIEGIPGSGKTHVIAGISIYYAMCGASVLMFAPTVPQAVILAAALRELLELAESNDLEVMTLYNNEAAYEAMRNERSLTAGERKVSFIVTTPNAVCETRLCSPLGTSCENIIVVHDDADALIETEILATMFAIERPSRVRGLILAGDTREWPLDIVSQKDVVRCIKDGDFAKDKDSHAYSYLFTRFFEQRSDTQHVEMRNKPLKIKDRLTKKGEEARPKKEVLEFFGGYNEFADQMGLDMLSRLRRQGFRTMKLQIQHRMRPDFTNFPNARTYKHSIVTSGPAERRPCHPKFENLLREWLQPDNKTNANTTRQLLLLNSNEVPHISLTYLKASRGGDHCRKDENSRSKYNCRNVEVVLDLLERNRLAEAMCPADICIITPYSAQTQLYNQMFEEKVKTRAWKPQDIPRYATIDQMRGQESRVIILDLTVTLGDRHHSIGIIANELRATIAVTRAEDFLIIVGSHEFIHDFPQFWHWLMVYEKKPKEPLPYLVEYAADLEARGLSFTPPTPHGSSVWYVPSTKMKTDDDCDHLWARWLHRTPDFDRNDD